VLTTSGRTGSQRYTLGTHAAGRQGSTTGTSGQYGSQGTAGQPARTAATRQPFSRRARVRVSPPSCREPFRTLAHEEGHTEDGPHPAVELGAVAARSKHRRSRRPCHSRAISSGLDRSRADNYGQRRSSTDLRGVTPLQVTIAADLALGAGSRIVYSCFRQFDPCGWRVLLDAVLRWRIRFRSRRLPCRRDGIRRA
jgi:hypothetical protein